MILYKHYVVTDINCMLLVTIVSSYVVLLLIKLTINRILQNPIITNFILQKMWVEFKMYLIFHTTN